MLTVTLLAGPFEPPPAKTDAGGGRDGFAPLFAGLIGPDHPLPDCTPLPRGGENVPVADVGLDAPDVLPDTPIADGIAEAPDTPPRFVPAGAGVVAGAEPGAPVLRLCPRATPLLPAAVPPRAALVDARPSRLVPSPATRLSAAPSDDGSAPVGDGNDDEPAADALIAAATADSSALLPTPLLAGAVAFAAAPVQASPTPDATISPRHPGPFDPARGIAQQQESRVVSGPAIAPAETDHSITPLVAPAERSAVPAQGRGQGGAAAATRRVSEQVSGTPAAEPSPSPYRATPASPSATPVILPALQAFGAAMRQALAEERKPVRVAGDPAAGITGLAAAMTPAAAPPIVPGSPLDTADQRWPQAMAEQIERLRDAADSQSTRIRLLPDALGPVDVSVRREGDQVHVHFTAAEAQTRQLLTDAQPRLADAAEARGLKLGRTDVAGGELANERRDTGDRQQRAPTQPPQPGRPAPARGPATAGDDTDTRIA